MSSLLSSTDQQLLFELIMACHADTPDNFDLFVYPKLRELLPHDMFAHGSVNSRNGHLRQYVNTSFPEEYLRQHKNAEGWVECNMLEKWIKLQRPVYFEQKSSRHAAVKKSLVAPFCEFNLRNIVIHGVIDAAKTAGSCYAFAGLTDDWSQRSAIILRIVTPHLHAAITFRAAALHARTTAAIDESDTTLTSRELSVLRQLSEGKSNIEIGTSLAISVCTVRAHLQNITRKLDASNRVHAITRAVRLGLIHL